MGTTGGVDVNQPRFEVTPVGRVEVASREGGRVLVRNLEALDGTPILDVKPVPTREIWKR